MSANNALEKLSAELESKLDTAKQLVAQEEPDYAAATKIANEVLSKDPQNFKALNLLVYGLTHTGNTDTAMKVCEYALKLYPNDPAFYENYAEVYANLEQEDKAIESYLKALELGGNNLKLYSNLGYLLVKAERKQEAIDVFKKAHKSYPDDKRFPIALCSTCYGMDHKDFGYWLQVVNQNDPNPTMELALKTYVQPVYDNQEEIDKDRAKVMESLEDLIKQGHKLNSLSDKFFHSIFYLAYHNRNNKKLRMKYAEYFEQAAPDLLFEAPHVKKPRKKGGKIKVGFISMAQALNERHPVARCFNELFIKLAQNKDFEVHCIITAHDNKIKDKDPDINWKLARKVHAMHKVKEDFHHATKFIADLELDVLIYTDIGMFFLTYYLAFARLARVQAVLPGHPDTTGIRNMDYYLSSKYFEEEEGQQYYSERLIKFDEIITSNEPPPWNRKPMSRAEQKLPEDKNIYYCPMKNQKIHPDFDWAIKEILDKDPRAMIMFPKDSGKTPELVRKRIKKHLGKKYYDRVYFHPWANNQEFMSYLSNADVIIDTFYFGSGTTAYFIFDANAPAITLPSKTSGGRVLNAVYKRMGIEELIAKDKKDFVKLALKTATDKKFNQEMREKIKEKKDIIFNNASVTPELIEFLKNVSEDPDYYKKNTDIWS
jgi:protein O-GlcNAc transferase